MDLYSKEVRDSLRERKEREKSFPDGLFYLMFFWVLNLIFLGAEIAYSEGVIQILSILSFIGVFGTGVLQKVQELHVLAGALGAICNGLALGYASQCNLEEYELTYLIIAAVCNIISGTVAHEYFVKTTTGFTADAPQSMFFISFAVIIIHMIALLSRDGYPERAEWQGPNCIIDDTGYYFFSSFVHCWVFGLLWGFFDVNDESGFYRVVNFPFIHAACIVSSFGLTISWYWPDIVLFVAVQVYIISAHGRVLFSRCC
jgi:hypothetical protein